MTKANTKLAKRANILKVINMATSSMKYKTTSLFPVMKAQNQSIHE